MHTRSLIPRLRFALPLALVALSGCPGEPPHPPLTGTGMDMFGPVTIRVHPLTRISTSVPTATAPAHAAPQITLETRLEFSDQFQDTGKAVGSVTLEIFEYQLLLPDHRGSGLARISFDLSTPAANQKYWDPITRTYLFKIPLDPATTAQVKAKKSLVVAASFTLPNGGTLADQFILSPK